MITGRVIGVGVGPGDPELITVKALKAIRNAPVVAYISANGRPSMARQIAAEHIAPVGEGDQSHPADAPLAGNRAVRL